MEDRLIHSVALNLSNRLNCYVHRDGNDFLRLVYGMEVFIMNASKLLIVFILSHLLGIFIYTISVLVGFNFARRAAHGLHASNSTACTVSSILLFIAVPYLLKDVAIGSIAVLLIFCVVILLLFLYAPADTESRPLVGRKKRARLKKRAVISGITLMLGTLLIGEVSTVSGGIQTMLTLGAVYEVVSVLPLTYGILNKNYRNYEQYEKQLTAAS